MQQLTAAAGCNASNQQPLAPGADVQQSTGAVSDSSSSSSSHLLVQKLRSAVDAGDSSRVEQLLDSARADMTESQLEEALCCASADGCSEVVAALLAASVPVDAAGPGGLSALHKAGTGGHIDTVQVLLKAGADVGARSDIGTTPLHHAALQGNLLVAHELLAAGAGCDARCDGGFTPLQVASMRGHVSVVKALLAAGADVTAAAGVTKVTAAHMAASRGHADVMRELLAAGADSAVGDANGRIALVYAGCKGHVAVVQLLVGAVRSKQQWIRAATQAVQYGHTGVVDALLAAPAELQDRNCLLVEACECGSTPMVEYLLSIGLESSLPSSSGRSALAAAAYHGHVDAVILLLRASKQQAPTHAQVVDALHMPEMWGDWNHVMAQLLLHLHQSGDTEAVHDVIFTADDDVMRMALLEGWAAEADSGLPTLQISVQQQQQQQALVALEQDMAGSRLAVMGLMLAVQLPAVGAAAAQEVA